MHKKIVFFGFLFVVFSFFLVSVSGTKYILLNRPDTNLSLTDVNNASFLSGVPGSGYIRTDGSSTTTQPIPFAQGITIPTEYTSYFGSNYEFAIDFDGDTAGLYGIKPIKMFTNVGANSYIELSTTGEFADVNLVSASQSCLINSHGITDICTNGATGKIEAHAFNGFVFHNPLTVTGTVKTNTDVNANRFCLSNGTCATTSFGGTDTNWQTSWTAFDANMALRYLKLNQAVPQTVSGGLPIFSSGIQTTNINSGSDNSITVDDGFGNMAFTATSGITIGIPQGNLTLGEQLISNVANPFAPFSIASTTLNTNLNADLFDSVHVGTSGNTIGKLNTANTWSATQLTDSTHDFNSGRIVRANTGFSFGSTIGYTGTISYLKDLTTTCYADINGGIVTKISGAGCP